MRFHRYVLASGLALLPFAPACHCAGDATHTTTGVIGPKTEHEVNCNCIVNWDSLGATVFGASDAQFDFALCLPPDLNTATADPTQLAALNAMSDSDYATAVIGYCKTQVGPVINSVIGILEGEACSHIDSIQCTPEIPVGQNRPTATDVNDICDLPCATVACNQTNCVPSQVIDSSNAIHPEECKCTQATGCGSTSPVFCDRPPGNTDPPTIASGMLTTLLSYPIVVKLDHAASTVSVTVNIALSSDTETPNVDGKVTLYGVPCPGASCDMLLDMSLFPDDFTLSYSVLGDHPITNFSIVGGTGPTLVHIDPSGTGHIPAGALSYIADGVKDGSDRRQYRNTNDQEIQFQIDFVNRTFSLGNASESFPDGSGTLNLSGNIVALPPRASAGTPQQVECASHVGTPVTLDASASTDLENDINRYAWWRGTALDPASFLGTGETFPVVAPLGSTEYQVSVSDHHMFTSVAATQVTVVDTSPPAIMPPSDVVVECSAPAGQPVAIGTATVADVCDPSPSLSNDAPADYQVGTTVVHYASEDASGNVSAATQNVTVVDTIPPTLNLSVTPGVIWPPNGAFIPITVTATASSVCSVTVPITLISATATEPGGKKPVPPGSIVGADIGTADFSFLVEADRSGTAPEGRFYTFTYDAVDAHGLHTVKSVVVNVPHNQ